MAVFACFYPSPGLGTDAGAWSQLSTPTAFMIEVVLTAFLLMMVFALTEPDNPGLPQAGLGPLFIGLTVTEQLGSGALDGRITLCGLRPASVCLHDSFDRKPSQAPRGTNGGFTSSRPFVGGL